MKMVQIEKEKILLDSIEEGECFISSGRVFMKISPFMGNSGSILNAVSLDDGSIWRIDPSANVYFVKAELHYYQ